MMEIVQNDDLIDPEITLLKEWLPKIGNDNLSYLKGALNALIYVQETQDFSYENEGSI